MSLVNGVSCDVCQETHPARAFISHAKDDAEIASRVREASCHAQVSPYLFEYTQDKPPSLTPAQVLGDAIASSTIVLVVLGPAISEVYWTQAWIGFEIGVSKGFDIGRETTNNYVSKKIVVLEDIRQGIKVSVPSLDALWLFDFETDENWEEYSQLIQFLTLTGDSKEVFQAGNQFRLRNMEATILCQNCNSAYACWIRTDDQVKLEIAPELTDIQNLPLQANCTVTCPSCQKAVSGQFKRML